MIAAMVVSFFVFALMRMPLAFALGLAALVGMTAGGIDWLQLPGKMVHAIDKFPLLAIPLFMLAGQLMLRGGIMDRLVEFANAVVGRVQGGLAHVTVVSAMGLSAVSGSALADAAALGSSLRPSLTKAYSREFGASVVTVASNLGPIIPPSAAVIVYAIMAGHVSIGGLFMAGILPGILLGLGIMGMCSLLAHRRGYPVTGDPIRLRNVLRETRRSIIVFMMPVVVIGGIIGGAFTATEGAAIAVVYALFIGFFITRKLRLSDLPVALLEAGIVTAVVGALIAFSSSVTYLFTIGLVAAWLSNFLQSVAADPMMFIIIVMLVLVVVGMFMEANASFVMLAPIIAPIAILYEIDPIYFGFLFVLNIVIGGTTPPVGILLFASSGIWQVPMGRLIREIWPFILVQYAVLILCVVFPNIVMFLPRLVGY